MKSVKKYLALLLITIPSYEATLSNDLEEDIAKSSEDQNNSRNPSKSTF